MKKIFKNKKGTFDPTLFPFLISIVISLIVVIAILLFWR